MAVSASDVVRIKQYLLDMYRLADKDAFRQLSPMEEDEKPKYKLMLQQFLPVLEKFKNNNSKEYRYIVQEREKFKEKKVGEDFFIVADFLPKIGYAHTLVDEDHIAQEYFTVARLLLKPLVDFIIENDPSMYNFNDCLELYVIYRNILSTNKSSNKKIKQELKRIEEWEEKNPSLGDMIYGKSMFRNGGILLTQYKKFFTSHRYQYNIVAKRALDFFSDYSELIQITYIEHNVYRLNYVPHADLKFTDATAVIVLLIAEAFCVLKKYRDMETVCLKLRVDLADIVDYIQNKSLIKNLPADAREIIASYWRVLHMLLLLYRAQNRKEEEAVIEQEMILQYYWEKSGRKKIPAHAPKIRFENPSKEARDFYNKVDDQSKICANCGIQGDNYKRCTRCKAVYYCSQKCQLEHWPQHKVKCEINEDAARVPKPKSAKVAGGVLKPETYKEVKENEQKGNVIYFSTTTGPLIEIDKEIARSTEPAISTLVETLFEETVPHECATCKKQGNKMKRCSRCHNVWYCSTQCQASDWPSHKKVCK